MDLEVEVKELKKIVESLRKEVDDLKKQIINDDSSVWRNNTVDDYMIKLVFPGIYCNIDKPTAAFPKNRRKIAEQLYPGQYMFMYVTSPVKKIIALAKVTSACKENPGSRWPYYVDLEWVIKPRTGLTLNEDCGLDIRPRPGDTLYSLSKDKANEIINKLKSQKELDENTLEYLANEYKESDKK